MWRPDGLRDSQHEKPEDPGLAQIPEVGRAGRASGEQHVPDWKPAKILRLLQEQFEPPIATH